MFPDEGLPSKRYSALKTLAEISKIITSSHDHYETLSHTAQMIAERIQVDACSIYIYDNTENCLILRATFGLNSSSVDSVKMPVSEGLVGLVMELSEAVQVADMKLHPRFKFFPQTNEDLYSSFLGVPLIEHRKPFGVLVVHTLDCRNFTEEEEHILITIASQISGFISKALLIKKLDQSAEEVASESQDPYYDIRTRIEGTPVASGFAIGKAAVLKQQTTVKEPEKESSRTVLEELNDFRDAIEHTITDILQLIEKVSDYLTPEESSIFHVHLLFLEDRGFVEKIENTIKSGTTAVWAIYHNIEEHIRAFETIDDPYLKEKGSDLKDVGSRLLHYFGHGLISFSEKEGILVTKQLLPGDVARLDTTKIKGIITSTGGVVSHAAILARSLLIPSICIPEETLEEFKDGDQLAIDGQKGYAVIHPTEKDLEEFHRMLVMQQEFADYLEEFRERPCETKDGFQYTVLANVGFQSDSNVLEYYGAEGIGLYRSEVFFLTLETYPSIPQQVVAYSQIIESVETKYPVIFRTLDLGADKAAAYMRYSQEENPFLGFRAIRRQLGNPKILKSQIKALLLATGSKKNVKLLFPMITNVSELREAKKLYQECRSELRNDGNNPPSLEIGMMFEVPGAILLCDQFMPEIDFCAIGSNDLTQYVLAVDRNNPFIADLYDPLHPAVLKLIYTVAQSAEQFGKPVEICGEMASDPDGCIILLGLGINQLSMNASLIPVIKERLISINLSEAREVALKALEDESATKVRERIADAFPRTNDKLTLR